MNEPSSIETELSDYTFFKAWNKDQKEAAKLLNPDQVRYLVDSFYRWQEQRIRAAAQQRSAIEAPNAIVCELFTQMNVVETRIKQALDAYTDGQQAGVWCKSQKGIGPVITAGLLAHIDIEKAPTVSHIWRFAGLDPTTVWGKGEKRPFNADLKVLCWKMGESFVKVSGKEDAYYGQLYKQRKEMEQKRNDAGDNAEAAAGYLAAKKFGKETEAFAAYTAGKLPPAQIHNRATRWARKVFLSHLHEVLFYLRYEKLPPAPYAIQHLGHADYLNAPHTHLIPGLDEAKRKAGWI